MTKEAHIEALLLKNGLNENWIRVAKLEAGAQLNSHVAQQANNYFGMHRSAQRRTTACGHYYHYSQYASIEDCVRDLRHWSDLRPQRPDETFDQWLKHRGWNHLPTYFATLAQVKV